MSKLRCPQCGSRFDGVLSTVMPFCSIRCQQLDLRLWLNEEHCLPFVPANEEDAEEWLQQQEDQADAD